MKKQLSRAHFLFFFLSLALALLVAGCAAHKDLSQTLRTNFQAPEGSPMLLAAYQPWFGKSSHINVGYSSQDEVVLRQQIIKAKGLGIGGFVVNWYGPRKDFEDRAYAAMQTVANDNDFKVALMYDEIADRPGDVTNETISDMQYAYQHYISSNSIIPSTSYLRYNGRPLIFIFPKNGGTDWGRVREAVESWPDPPLLIYKDINPRVISDMDGFYAWVKPSHGWGNDEDWGRDYLDSFYSKMKNRYPDKIAVGAAWPGFDDRHASWSQHRRMDARCGKTFQDSLRMYRNYFGGDRPLPFLMIVTWNDYEEGTAIERGLKTCG